VLDAGQRGGGDGDGIAIAAQSIGRPEDVNFLNGGLAVGDDIGSFHDGSFGYILIRRSSRRMEGTSRATNRPAPSAMSPPKAIQARAAGFLVIRLVFISSPFIPGMRRRRWWFPLATNRSRAIRSSPPPGGRPTGQCRSSPCDHRERPVHLVR